MAMFERFTDRTRRVVVLAQEEALLLNHADVGTEHVLLGLMREGEGAAAQALKELDITLQAVREMVKDTTGRLARTSMGAPQFDPRAKKVLELSLREALQLGHDYIGTEHILLGLVREGEGVGAQILVSLGAELSVVRQTVIQILVREGALAEEKAAQSYKAPGTARARRRSQLVFCSFCGRNPPETGRLIASRDSSICEHCIREWHDTLKERADYRHYGTKARIYDPDDRPEDDQNSER